MQYTATYDSGPTTAATSYVRGFRTAMTPTWGDGAYVNYADASLQDYQRAYFGANAARLAQAAGFRKAYNCGGKAKSGTRGFLFPLKISATFIGLSVSLER